MLNGNRVIALRARARRGWSIKRIARTFGVARNTVRRYVRQGAPVRGLMASPTDVEHDLDLVRRIVGRWNTRDKSELESALTLELAKLQRFRGSVTHWSGFLLTALRRKAMNWGETQRRRERRTVSGDTGQDDDAPSLWDRLAEPESTDDARLALEALRPHLLPGFRQLLDALVRERFNKLRAARRLGIHRNTFDKRLRRLRAALACLRF